MWREGCYSMSRQRIQEGTEPRRRAPIRQKIQKKLRLVNQNIDDFPVLYTYETHPPGASA